MDQLDLSVDQLARLVLPGGALLVASDGGHDPDMAGLTSAAIEIAGLTGATVVLFDRSGSVSASLDPPRSLRAADLDRFGRSDLAAQLRAFCQQSVRASGWLAGGRGTRELVTAVELTRSGLVLFPPDRASALRRVVRRTLPYYASRIPVPLATVDAAGRIQLVEPLTRP
jgi:hypothetical protein